MRGLFSRYGAGPGHLALMLGCFVVVAYVVWHAASAPLPLRMAIWFAGAVVGHDFVLFPAYSLFDRVLARSARRRGADPGPRAGTVNYVRVPLLLSGLLLLVFGSVIIGAGEASYLQASGLSFAPYLMRWAILSAALLVAGLLVLVVRRRRADRAARPVSLAG